MRHTIGLQQGFTLIELVVVIALLAILAAAALPRMMKSYDGAHEASVAATGGALASAVILVRSQWVTNGAPGAASSVKGYGDDNIATSSEGWPTDAGQGAASNHSSTVAGDTNRCIRLWQALLIENAPIAAAAVAEQVDYLAEAPGGTVCRYTYLRNGAGSNIEYNLQSGSVITVL
jgi:MSHA pilin protein MshB